MTQNENIYSAKDFEDAMLVDGRSNVLQEHNTPLTDSEIRCINELRRERVGDFTLKQLYGDYWYSIRGHRKFGRRFKAAVLRGDMPGVRWVRQRSDRSQVYEVLPQLPGVTPTGRPLPSHHSANSASVTSTGLATAA